MGDVVTPITTAAGRWFGRLWRPFGTEPGILERIREALWVLNTLLFLTLVPPALLAASDAGEPLRIAAAVALVGAIGWEAAAVRAGRFPLWADVLETATVLLLTSRFPPQPGWPVLLFVLAFALPALGFRALFGRPWQAAARAVAVLAAIYCGKLINIAGHEPSAAFGAVFPEILPVAFIATLGQVVKRMMRQQEALNRRQRVAAKLNADLIAAQSRGDVHAAIVEAVIELLERRPDIRALMWDEESTALPAAAAGYRAEEAIGLGLLSGSLPRWIVDAVDAGEPVYSESVDVEDIRKAIGFDPIPGATFIVPLRQRDVRRVLTIGAGKPIPIEARREIETFAKVVEIALESIDLTEKLRSSEEALRQRSYYDPITRLPNRELLRARLEWALSRSQRRVAVLLLDLDHFKTINDSLGHLAGDETLVAVAERLAGTVRPGDMVARLGGDEFVVFLSDIATEDEAVRVARRVLELLDDPITGIVGRPAELMVRGSVGVALSGPGARVPEDLIRNAEVAMYAAKAAGGATFRVFEPAMRASVQERLELEIDLNKALERGELALYYQPIVELGRGAVVGVEALLRWRHPTRGMIPPSAFIPLAEETGMIGEIGAWVLREGCRQLAAWSTVPGQEGLTLGVNLSPKQLEDPDLVDTIRGGVADAGLQPSRLTLELTESALVEQTETNLARLESIKALGAQLAMDDFGTGFSSLGYLRRFPFDILKIDRSFIHGVEADPDAAALARAIMKMGQALGLRCLAEGVETEAQLEWLRGSGCQLAQGNFLASAMAPERLDRLFAGELIDGALPWFARRR
jgi:diguanylate cyclase (GGDEF)-like protein